MKVDAKTLSPEALNQRTTRSIPLPFSPPNTATAMGVPINGATIDIINPVPKATYHLAKSNFLAINPTTRAMAMLTSPKKIAEAPVVAPSTTFVNPPVKTPHQGPNNTGN